MSSTQHHPAHELITVTRCGHTFTASRRTVQHLDWTIARLKRFFPWARLEIIQPCYRSRVPGGGASASAGTHDYDCVFDFRIRGLGWRRAQKFLRRSGWAAFWRHTGIWSSRSEWHIHAVSLPRGLPQHPTAAQVGLAYHTRGIVVGVYIDGGVTTRGYVCASSQVVDYMASPPRDALADHAPDPTFHPRDIPATAYAYNPWRAA